MFNRRKIQSLQDRIEKLEWLVSYIEWGAVTYTREQLSAWQIIDRFNELYKKLNIERVTTPEETKLVEKKKK